MRLNDKSSVLASVLIINVLASPGTPSSMTWPRLNKQIRISSITFSWPTMILPSSSRIFLRASCSRPASAWLGEPSCWVEWFPARSSADMHYPS